MRRTLFLLGICTLSAAGLFGGKQLFEVTPQSLDGWQISGAELPKLTAQSGLTLPAGAQLSRSFSSGAVALHLISQPFFENDPAAWPSVEVGPASLALLRDEEGGKLVLIVGDATPIALPAPIALGEDGRSAQPLDLTLSFDSASGLVTVTVPGQPVFSGSGAAGGLAVEVAIAAGTEDDWTFGSLDVVVAKPDDSSVRANTASSSGSGKSDPAPGDKGGGAQTSSSASPVASASHLAPAVANSGSPAAIPPAPGPAHTSLEVFTPPSVRLRPAQTPSGNAEANGTTISK